MVTSHNSTAPHKLVARVWFLHHRCIAGLIVRFVSVAHKAAAVPAFKVVGAGVDVLGDEVKEGVGRELLAGAVLACDPSRVDAWACDSVHRGAQT